MSARISGIACPQMGEGWSGEIRECELCSINLLCRDETMKGLASKHLARQLNIDRSSWFKLDPEALT